MNHTHGNNPMNQYRTVDAYGAASAGDRLQLIARMLQGALDRIATARGHMQRGEQAPKGEALGRAVRMIDGLRSCLDHERGGEVAANLGALYEYMTRRLTEANLRNDQRALDEVADLLDEIRSGWEQMMATPSLRAVPAATAGADRGPA
ncbi:MAG: flagellar export chaperone FliS [Gammaproteobacteria bacterium]|nr:flagellar export chaperone FliS [Gammaproteobacteria bacterium]